MRRHNDFEAEVRAADTKALEANLKFIHDARGEEWTAAAWLVERGWPELYARPELQLNQINVAGSEVTISLSAADLSAMQAERERAIELLGRTPALPTNGEESYAVSQERDASPDLGPDELARMEAERQRALTFLDQQRSVSPKW
jgi:hypothetical protein